MPRDHLVPQAHLRRFATTDGRLLGLPRRGGPAIPLSVRKACAETNFYDLELEEQYQHEFPPRRLEHILSAIEGAAESAIRKLLDGEMHAFRDEDRYNLDRFLSFQLVRSWSFRDDLSEIATLRARNELAARIDPAHVRRFLTDRGDPHDDESVKDFFETLLTSNWKIRPSGSMAVQAMAAAALSLVPRLAERNIAVLHFDEPSLITSDQPAALWAHPSRNLNVEPLGVANADAIWMPLDRQHALAFTRTGPAAHLRADPARARQINGSVAAGARRWIFQHPDDPPYDTDVLAPLAPFVTEPTSAVDAAGDLRVGYRTIRKAT